MAFGGFHRGGTAAPMAEINMIPLIDVMLVLLVIFIITAPLLTHAVKVELPHAASEAYWNGEALDRSGWRSRMDAVAAQRPQPEVHLRADANAAYRRVAELLSDAARAGLTRVGFVTDPRDAP
jgi:biopolymer transport protein ExbD